MSGHSHFATIKRLKEAKDQAKGKIFSRHSKAIALAIKAGGVLILSLIPSFDLR